MSKNAIFLLTTLLFFSARLTHSVLGPNQNQNQIPENLTIQAANTTEIVAKSPQLPIVSFIDPLDNCRQVDTKGKCIKCFTNYKLSPEGLCIRQQIMKETQDNCLIFSQQTNSCLVCEVQYQYNAGKCIKIQSKTQLKRQSVNNTKLLQNQQSNIIGRPLNSTNQADNSIVQPLELLTAAALEVAKNALNESNSIKQDTKSASPPLLLSTAAPTPVLNIKNSTKTSLDTTSITNQSNASSSSQTNSQNTTSFQPIDPTKFNITIVIDPKTKIVITIVGTTLFPPEARKLPFCVKYRDITYQCVQCQTGYKLFQQKCYDRYQYEQIIQDRGLVYNQPNSN